MRYFGEPELESHYPENRLQGKMKYIVASFFLNSVISSNSPVTQTFKLNIRSNYHSTK